MTPPSDSRFCEIEADGVSDETESDSKRVCKTLRIKAATNTGKEGCAVSLGIQGKAKGANGCWLTLAEWKYTDCKWHRIDVQTIQVDGKKIKADTFYILVDGKFQEADKCQ